MLPNSSNEAEINNGGTAQLTASGSVRDLYLGRGIAGMGNVEITGSGSLSSRHGFIADGFGSVAVVSLSGSSAKWNTTSSGNINVGVSGTGTLTILDGADVTSTAGVLAQQDGSGGTVRVSGAGSTWVNTSDISVGALSTGELNIESGGAVTSRDLFVATGMSTLGTVIISGTGSSWSRNISASGSGQVEIGVMGTGRLFLSGSGTLTSLGPSYLGKQSGSTGEATISGTNTVWTNTGDLTIGGAGTGTVLIQSGGRLANTAGLIAGTAGLTSSVTVTGTGSMFTNSGRLDVGVNGIGQMTINNGGQVTSAVTNGTPLLASSVGRNVGSVGTVDIQGDGSLWTASSLDVGIAGKGTVNLSGGGDLSTGSTSIGGAVPPPGPSVVSKINVTGTGCVWTATGWTMVGDTGEGELNITLGGKVLLQPAGRMWIGDDATGKGVVNLNGLGSELNIGDDLHVGNQGKGELHISNLATVSTKYAYVGNNYAGTMGTVTIADAGSTWTNSNTLGMGIGDMTISGGGKLFTNEPNPIYASSVGSLAGGVGTVTVTGPGSAWTSPAAGLHIGNVGGTGILNISNGGAVSNGESVMGRYDPLSNGTVNIDGVGSTWTNSGRLDVGLVGTGIINVTNGGALSSASARVGGQVTGIGIVSVGSGSTWNNAGTLEVGINGSGTLEIHGTLTAPGGTTIDNYGASGTGTGRLTGTGTINSNVTNNGTVAPGASPGTLTISGTFFDTGKLEIELASAASFDKLLVTGAASLFGPLEVMLLGSFVPAASDSFEILTAGSRSFTFSSVTVKRNAMDAGTFNVMYTPTSVILANFQPLGGLPGDYNLNGVVDGADYVVWRNGGATYTQTDYELWRANFGRTLGGGSGSMVDSADAAAVPEPSVTNLVLATLICLCGTRLSCRARG